MALLDKSLKQIFPSVEKTFSERAKIYFIKEYVKVCTTESFTIIIDSVLSARKESIDAKGNVDPAKFNKLLEDKLKSALIGIFTKRAKAWGESLSEEAFKDMNH